MLVRAPAPDPDPELHTRAGRRVVECKRWNPSTARYDVLWFELQNPTELEDGTKLQRTTVPGTWRTAAGLELRARRRAIYNPAGTQ